MQHLQAKWAELKPIFAQKEKKIMLNPELSAALITWRKAVYEFLQDRNFSAIEWNDTFTQCTISKIFVFSAENSNEHESAKEPLE